MKCFVCNNNEWSEKYDNLLKCKQCGFVRARNHFFNIKSEEIYNQKYFLEGEYANYFKESPALIKNFKDRLKIITRHKKFGKLLEIGSAYGYFLKEASRFFNSEGIDLDANICKQARIVSKSKVICGDFLKTRFEKNTFDIVCLFDTIEHLKQPKEYLQKINKILKKNGIIVIETGDMDALLPKIQGKKWRLIDPNVHLSYFTQKSLTNLLENCNFKVITISHPSFARTIRQIFYRTLKKELKHFEYFANLTIKINTFDLIFVIAKKA